MKRIPVTIISGYLGAGKTTLINRLLSEDHGLRLTVLVNDFGRINIDESLLQDANAQTIALSNGCVCCTLGEDLTAALHRILAEENHPDHIVIEASGLSDPVAIANTVVNEAQLSYGGIITVADSENLSDLLGDDLLRDQVSQQIRAADLVLISKCDTPSDAVMEQLNAFGARTPTLLDDAPVADLLFDVLPLPVGTTRAKSAHHAYATWHHRSNDPMDRCRLGDKLANRPDGLYRMKGFVLTNGGGYELHVVGRQVSAKRCEAEETVLVALGPAARISREDIEDWWHS
ncbi:CobW family GTP-binding protein [Phaeobacter inhibens]|uniref:CobW family GTP-binding protein n=1 Tax=Phaeobacter inhibens TaxID=221822 RepID=UPI0021A66F1B|nr:CobW family GTP-binding protein [Phaeobacter inhibens]UWR99902.1 GTP-binding protein [Phaeobacter inhibens]